MDPLAGARARDPGAPTINAKKRRWRAPWEVSELEIREHPPSTLENINGGPPLAVADKDPGASTINVKKHRWRAICPPWGVWSLSENQKVRCDLHRLDR
jgi:hypothetical protein